MKQRIRDLWINHLRSGWYEQNFETYPPLRTSDDLWSAFGILCNIYAIEHKDAMAGECRKTEFLGYYFLIPSTVRDEFGITDRDIAFKKPIRIGFDVYRSVQEMIDAGCDFSITADMIELYL